MTACDDKWLSFQGSCYLFVDQNRTWADATRHCSSYGAHLVSVETPVENAFLRDHAKKLSGCANTNIVYWIGGTDDEVDSIWKWYHSNKPINYTHWAPGQPQGTKGEDCLEMTQLHNYDGWDDDFCTNEINYICEKSTVTPSSSVNPPRSGCDDGWMSFSGSCYLFIEDIKENWTQAINHCSSHRSHLATIESSAENNFIVEQTQKIVKCDYPGFWLGASDREVDGVWTWHTSGEPVSYTNWHTGVNGVQPQNGTDEDCLCILEYAWHDCFCYEKLYFICETLVHYAGIIIG